MKCNFGWTEDERKTEEPLRGEQLFEENIPRDRQTYKTEDHWLDGPEQQSKENEAVDRRKWGGVEYDRPIANQSQVDYLQLLKYLNIKLPEGVITEQVVTLTNDDDIIKDAREILTELEDFHIRFKATPRLSCREVKHYLGLMDNERILEITKGLFFEKEDKREQCERQWRDNQNNTGQGFRLRTKYYDKPISTPAMDSTAKTRSRGQVEVGEDSPIVTQGTQVHLSSIEGVEYSNESELWNNKERGKFGMFSENKCDELEMLKFFHESVMLKKPARYSKGNKVEYGFLSGNLDFLASIEQKAVENRGDAPNSCQQLAIECKGTTGDMVGKVFTKHCEGNRANIVENHEYSFQVQAYMYILNKEAQMKEFPQMKRGVMVFRHYHPGGMPPKDFCWNYLEIDSSIQENIEQLRLLCLGKALAQYLAVLNLIFEKEI